MGGPGSLEVHVRRGGNGKAARTLASCTTNEDAIDPYGLAGWVLAWAPNGPRTPYAHCTVRLREEPEHAVTGPVPRASEAPAFLLRELDAATDRALAGVKRAAVLAGGGVDSSILSMLVARWAKRTGGSYFLVALDFESEGDDRPHLRTLEVHLGCDVLRVTPEDASGRIEAFHRGVDAAPLVAPTSPMEIELLARAKVHGAERVLSGSGGDELFGGTPLSLSAVARSGHPLRAALSARKLRGFGMPRSRVWSWVVRPMLGRALPQRLRMWRAARAAPVGVPVWAGPVLREFLEEKKSLLARQHVRRVDSPRARWELVRDEPQRVYLAWNRSQQEIAAGIDAWDPFLDLTLARAVTSLPPDALLYGGSWRGLFREAARGLVPDAILEREDKARFEPALRRFVAAAGGFEMLKPLASGKMLASHGLVLASSFDRAFEHLAAHPDDGEAWMTLWPALAVESFLRRRRS